jgi:hypothetical protein
MAQHIIELDEAHEAVAAMIPDFDQELQAEVTRRLDRFIAEAKAKQFAQLQQALSTITVDSPKFAAIMAVLNEE